MYIDAKGQRWLKGNLHTHTKRSDGAYTYEEACELYRNNDYDFICISDHWKFNQEDTYGDMLILSGCEYDVGKSAAEGIYHFISIGAEKELVNRQMSDPQEVIDGIHAGGGLAMLAHPAWSLNRPDDIEKLQGVDLSEIFNSVSDLPRNARPYSGLLFDMMAVQGNYTKMTAVDDTHFYYTADMCRSFIYVKAEECTREAVMEALKAGDFYCSQGPRIEITQEDGTIMVHTTPVEEIVYFTNTVWTDHRADVGNNLTEGKYEVKPTDTFVRVEVRDKDGKYAWSQYVIPGK